MEVENFKKDLSVNFYTILNLENNVIYNDDFQMKNYNDLKNNFYTILHTVVHEGIEFWQIKSIFEKKPVGWVKAKEHIKFINVIPQKILLNNKKLDNTINELIGLLVEFDETIFYTKRYMTIYNNTVYYGLFDKDEFIGFANIDSLNFGEITPIPFTFKLGITNVYSEPNLKYSIKLHNIKKNLLATSYFKTPNLTSISFTFGDKYYWINIDDVNINLENMRSREAYNIEDVRKEYYINSIRADNSEYYSVNQKFNTTDKLRGIIQNFSDTDTDSRLYKPININIGIICDEFMYYSLKDSANIEYIPFEENIKVNPKYDIVLVVSSWSGIDNSWHYVANPQGDKRQILINMLDKYNTMGIPTVFYSKEDPVNYHRFISIAEHCKYIYTSAVEVIEKYKEDTQNENVDYLQFSINPKYHNPLGKKIINSEVHNQVIFAGSWMKKYPTRNKESADIFDGVLESTSELNIIDRNFDRLLYDYQFPYIYAPYISKTIPHTDLMKLHKATSWGINLNSVKYSNTMFANRVYELQAMGNLIISNYSMGINNKFPYISIVHGKEDVIRTIESITESDKLEIIAKGISNVMLNHTATHRINKILLNLGYENKLKNFKILVIGSGKNVITSFEQQFYGNKTLITETEFNSYEHLKDYNYITYFSDEYIYEENYLNNLLSAFAYTDADVVEMSSKNIYDFKKSNVFNKFFSLIHANSFKNVNKVFNIPTTEILKNHITNTNYKNEKVLSVIIPIHNNGKYLEDKCFRSLKRSSIFNKMNIIMIDDGSTDIETLKIIKRIRRRHPEIVYYRFEKGSGSASRPRNKGIDMTTTKFVTFLDPDNEASGDGYKLLLDELEKDESLDLVLGNVLKEDNSKRSLLNYYYYVLTNNDGMDIVSQPKKFLIAANLRAHSIQALIVKTNILQDNNLKMIEGAAGQDTMFFQELLLHSNRFKTISDIIHIYYAAVDGSVTTTIKKSFFEKYLVLEKERVLFLKKHNLFEIYVNQRFPYYFVNWYCKKLLLVPKDDLIEAKNILKDILKMYFDVYNGNDSFFNEKVYELFNIKFVN